MTEQSESACLALLFLRVLMKVIMLGEPILKLLNRSETIYAVS